MQKKSRNLLLMLTAFLAAVGCGPAGPERVSGQANPGPKLPSQFHIAEQGGWTTKFDVADDKHTYGNIVERASSSGKSFRYTDASGKLVATAILTNSWYTHIDVYDSTGALIGAIQKKSSSLFSGDTYSILSSSGKEMAVSKAHGVFSTNFSLFAPDGRTVVTLNRGGAFKDNWTVTVDPQNEVDVRLLVMIGVYKTAADNDKD